VLPYRRLQSLCSLDLGILEVNLGDLGCLQPQLRRLELSCCSLSGAAGFFQQGWARLEVLLLGSCSIDADFGVIALPFLIHLELYSVRRAGELYGCAGLFGPGCPQCTHLRFGPYLSPAASCMGFGSLQSVEVSWDPVELRNWGAWPGPVPELDLPATVGSLTCLSRYCVSTHCSVRDDDYLDLYALLAMAGRIISSGGQLRELCLAQSATFVRKLTDAAGHVLLLQPSQQGVSSVYRPVCMSLHGLTALDLSGAPQCGLQAVAEVVCSAPDLTDLRLSVPPELSTGHRHVSSIPCSGLKQLTLSCGLKYNVPRIPGQLLDLEYVLEDAGSLDCVTAGLTADLLPMDRITLHLTCRAGSAIECSVDKALCREWGLRVVVQDALPEHPPARRALVSFCWEADKGWVCAVGYA
jgi:hypothetical protein